MLLKIVEYAIKKNNTGYYISLVSDSKEFFNLDSFIADFLDMTENEYANKIRKYNGFSNNGFYFFNNLDAKKFGEEVVSPAIVLNAFTN